ncbi:MAG: site-specific integrase [Victivallales bacterium]|nr:site-specific integrase [Victivallales bacterium]
MEKRTTFELWSQAWLRRKEPYIKYSTFAAYTNIVINHLIPYWGATALTDISEEQVQEYVLHLVSKGRLDGKGGINVRSARDIVVVFKGILRDAARLKMVSVPSFELHYPRIDYVHRVPVLSRAIQIQLVNAVQSDLTPASSGILLSLYTGLRIGEVCALRWDSIDLNEAVLKVEQTVQRVYIKSSRDKGSSKLLIGNPKTRTSRREVPLSKALLAILKRLPKALPGTFLLTGTEHCMEVRTFRSYYQNFLDRHSIPRINFHALRHTFATRCIECGADAKTVSELLGHATIAMTMNLYVHPHVEQKRNCVELITQ